MYLKLRDLPILQRGRFELKVEGIRDIANHVGEFKDAHALMKLLINLRRLLIRLEIALEGHIDLTSEQLVVSVLVADIHEHIVALKEELLCLLP